MRKALSCIIVMGLCDSISTALLAQHLIKNTADQIIVVEINDQVLQEYKPTPPQWQLLSKIDALLVPRLSGKMPDSFGGIITHQWNGQPTVLCYQLTGCTKKDLILQLLWGSVITPDKTNLI